MKNRFIPTVILSLLLCSLAVQAEILPGEEKTPKVDSVQVSVDYLKYFLEQNRNWLPRDAELERNLKGLVHFAEDEKIDTILLKLEQYRSINDSVFFFRPPNRVSDSLKVEGYVSQSAINEKQGQIERAVKNSIVRDQIAVPDHLLDDVDKKVRMLEKDEAESLLRDSLVVLPDSLRRFEAIPDSIISSPADFRRLQRMDSMKNAILEKARIHYNNNLLQQYIDSVSETYRDQYVQDYIHDVQSEYVDSVRNKNQEILERYNREVMRTVNDSIAKMIDILTNYAKNDSVPVWVQNSQGDSTKVLLKNNAFRYKRMYLKNDQNDSLGVRIHNTGKNSMQIFIDDAVTLNRFSAHHKKDFKFDSFEPEKSLRSIDRKYKVIIPWVLGGDGTFGFTQTAVRNWKKGGKNALSTLLVLKGYANYSYSKVKWENSLEIRNGWLQPADDKIQKNDDKFEVISRFGLSAYKKWYYSAEVDFQTQFFNGYKYPDRDNRISAFMAPSKTLIKLGMDYKPNKNFSLFLSPFTSKTIYVRDTANIDASNYGIPEGKKRFWEPGLNADVMFKTNISNDISYQMKYKMFINYNAPFSEFDIDWENIMVMQLNDFINLRMMVHLLYDDNVKFSTGQVDTDGKDILEPKWQIKEFITIGFSYKLNKRIFKREELN